MSAWKVLAFLVLFWLGICGDIQAQTEPGVAPITIVGIDWSIEGRVRQSYVASTANIEVGRVFVRQSLLDAYLKDCAQRLWNLRLFDEVLITETVIDQGTTGQALLAQVSVRVKESGTFIVLPGASGNDSQGFAVSAATDIYDFLGTGGELQFGLARTWAPPGSGLNIVGGEVSIPGYAGPVSWMGTAFVKPRVSDLGDFDLRASCGLSVTVPLVDRGGEQQLALVPSYSVDAAWGTISDLQGHPGLSLQFGRIDWHQNRRSGYLLDLAYVQGVPLSSVETITGQRVGMSVGTGLEGRWPNYALTGSVHALAGSGGEAMASASLRWSPGGDTNLGTGVRGIDPGRLDGEAGAYCSSDFWWNLGPFVFSRWLGMRWLRIFDVEVHAGPFLDAALPVSKISAGVDFSRLRFGTGLQIQSYALYSRPFYLYTAIGFDLRAAIASGTVLGNAADGYPIASLTSAIGVRY